MTKYFFLFSFILFTFSTTIASSITFTFDHPLELKDGYSEITVLLSYFDQEQEGYRSKLFVLEKYNNFEINTGILYQTEAKIEIQGAKMAFKLNVLLLLGQNIQIHTNLWQKCRHSCKEIAVFDAKHQFQGDNAEVMRYYSYFSTNLQSNLWENYYGWYDVRTDDKRWEEHVEQTEKAIKKRLHLIDSLIPEQKNFKQIKRRLKSNFNYTNSGVLLYEFNKRVHSQKIDSSAYYRFVNRWYEAQEPVKQSHAFVEFCSSIKVWGATRSANYSNYDYFKHWLLSGKFKANPLWREDYKNLLKEKHDFKTLTKKIDSLTWFNDTFRSIIMNDFYLNNKQSNQYFLDSMQLQRAELLKLPEEISSTMKLTKFKYSLNIEQYPAGIYNSYSPYWLEENIIMTEKHKKMLFQYFTKEEKAVASRIYEQATLEIPILQEAYREEKTLNNTDYLNTNDKILETLKKHKGKVIICQYWEEGLNRTEINYLEYLINRYEDKEVVFLNFLQTDRRNNIDGYENYVSVLKDKNIWSKCKNYIVPFQNPFYLLKSTNGVSLFFFDKEGNNISTKGTFFYYSDKQKQELTPYFLENILRAEKKDYRANEKEGGPTGEPELFIPFDSDFDDEPIMMKPRRDYSSFQSRKGKEYYDSIQKAKLAKPKVKQIPYVKPSYVNTPLHIKVDSIVNSMNSSPFKNSSWLKESLFKEGGWFVIEEENNCVYLSKREFKTRNTINEKTKWLVNKDKSSFYEIIEENAPLEIQVTYHNKSHTLSVNEKEYIVFYQDEMMVLLIKKGE